MKQILLNALYTLYKVLNVMLIFVNRKKTVDDNVFTQHGHDPEQIFILSYDIHTNLQAEVIMNSSMSV